MEVSLLQLTEKGIDLPFISPQEIRYAETGAAHLMRLEEKHFWFRARRALVHDLLRRYLESPAPVGLDIGCGSGYTSAWLSRRGLRTIGLDALPGFLGLRAQGYPFLHGDLLSVRPRPEFDFALLLDVIEHLPDERGLMRQAARLLKPNGVLVISVPALPALWSKVDELAQHFRRYTKQGLLSTVSGASDELSYVFGNYCYFSTLPLFYLSRLRARFSATENGIDQEQEISPRLNAFLGGILSLERRFFFRVAIPAGSSLLAVFRKRGE